MGKRYICTRIMLTGNIYVAAKQAAFEEQNRIRNQFRALDDDEIDFLDGIRDERRVEEDRVRRETEERLASFRRAQKSADRAAAPSSSAADEEGAEQEEAAESWGAGAAGRKRKRERERDLRGVVKGVKRRASGGEAAKETADAKAAPEPPSTTTTTTTTAAAVDKSKDADKPVDTKNAPNATSAAAAKPKLGLVDYGSDEDDDD
ncbi:hypothetical protein F5X99DRAFT_19309 [Biscogniauxia marginata]|nr:hypothetical protein F5X99DRAFT_19309 [Biscogniauxia marginata]